MHAVASAKIEGISTIYKASNGAVTKWFEFKPNNTSPFNKTTELNN